MCDNMILVGTPDEHYICDACLEELRAWRLAWAESTLPRDVHGLLVAFMTTNPGHYYKPEAYAVDPRWVAVTKTMESFIQTNTSF